MGMHTKASGIITQYGYNPASAHSTSCKPVAQGAALDRAVAELTSVMSKEGLVRIYACLAATDGASPTISIGDVPKAFRAKLKIAIDKGGPDFAQEIAKIEKDLAALKAKIK